VKGHVEPVDGYGNMDGKKFTPQQSIKHFCVECQGGHYFPWMDDEGTIDKPVTGLQDVRACTAKTCYLYPYRTGRSAYYKKKVAK